MSNIRTARLFNNGGSQAVRLPADFRFAGDLVYVRRDERTGDVILSSRPRMSWTEFMKLREQFGPLNENLHEREQAKQERDPFADWQE